MFFLVRSPGSTVQVVRVGTSRLGRRGFQSLQTPYNFPNDLTIKFLLTSLCQNPKPEINTNPKLLNPTPIIFQRRGIGLESYRTG